MQCVYIFLFVCVCVCIGPDVVFMHMCVLMFVGQYSMHVTGYQVFQCVCVPPVPELNLPKHTTVYWSVYTLFVLCSCCCVIPVCLGRFVRISGIRRLIPHVV